MANNLPTEKKAAVVSMLCEGKSIRGIERVTGIHRDTIMRLGVRMEQMHGARAVHTGSVPVREVFRGKPVWEGVVEAFDVMGHPNAKRAYAWEVPGPKPDYVGVLELPPITSPHMAVKAYVASLGA